MLKHAKLLLGVVLVGCASSVDDGVAIDSSLKYISFSPMYSAFDGTHEYAVTPSVPSAAPSKDEDPVLAASINWELDAAFVKRDEFPDLPAAIKLTTKKDGVTTVVMTAKSLSGHAIRSEAKLIISKAKQSEWDAGELRYNNEPMNPSMRPAAQGAEMCGHVLAIELPMTSCGNCHNAMSSVDFERTPAQTAGYSDEDLINIFTQGVKPAGATFSSPLLRSAPMPDCVYRTFHTSEMTDDEEKGVVWKLRSIPPKVHETQ